MRRIFTICFVALALLLAMLHWSYGLGYVYRVLLYQNPDTETFRRKPSISLVPAQQVRVLIRELSNDEVQSAFYNSRTKMPLETLMTENGSTSLLVVRDGKLIFERYYNGHKAEDLAASFSVTKSAFSILFGRVIGQNDEINLHQSITDFIPELAERNPKFQSVTLATLVDMRSGIGFDSDVGFPFFTEDETLVYYAGDLRRTLLKHPEMADVTGQFLYNDYGPNLLAFALERATNSDWGKILQDELWEVIGAEYPALWSSDYNGFPLVESGLVATPLDLARLGVAMLANTTSNGSRLLGDEWYLRSTKFDPSGHPPAYSDPDWYYRTLWWQLPRENETPDYSAMGHLGQYVYICPANGIVIVRTGREHGDMSDTDFLALFGNVCKQL